MIGENKIDGTVSVRRAHFHPEFFRVLMHNLLRVDPPALVDLFEQQESRVFRFPAKQQQQKKKSTLEAHEKNKKYKRPDA